MLTPDEVVKTKQALDECKKPLFIFHDDPDGLASFLLFYRYKQEGKGIPVKAHPHITKEWLRRVQEYAPDTVFILDIAMVDQEFIDGCEAPMYWIDHHTLQQPERCFYFNSRHKDNANICTPVMCWQVVGKERPQDLWIAAVGAIGDWYYPKYAEEFKEEYGDLLPKEINTVEEALFSPISKVAVLVKVFSFVLKGPMKDVSTNIKVMTRIESPYEILRLETPKGRLIWKHFSKINHTYEHLKAKALQAKPKGNLFVFTYSADELALAKDLANEMLYLLKDKVIILGRERSGEKRCAVRAPMNILLPPVLSKALVGIQGYGGGHEHAWGIAVKVEDWERFLENVGRELAN